MSDRLLNMAGAFALAVTDRVADAITSASGLGHRAAEGLLAVCNHPSEPVDALAERLALTPAGTTRLLDGLERRCLVRRVPLAGDKRSRAVEPTSEGRRLAFTMFRARREAIGRMLAPLSPAEQAELASVLARLLAASILHAPGALHPCRTCEQALCADAECCPT